ncbi:MAG: hypothetical protein EBZ59_11895 [Planctomycetia bacterium]|nr:hypothetical protein [Planctomycetia bacterium]
MRSIRGTFSVSSVCRRTSTLSSHRLPTASARSGHSTTAKGRLFRLHSATISVRHHMLIALGSRLDATSLGTSAAAASHLSGPVAKRCRRRLSRYRMTASSVAVHGLCVGNGA